MTLIAEPPAALACDRHGELVPDAVLRAAADPRLNQIESVIKSLPQADIPIIHRFTPGLYIREMRMPATALAISKIHKSTHPFVISRGRVTIWTENEGRLEVEAPYTGITRPGTRRLIYAHTDVVWTTFHPTDETDPQVVEDEIIYKHHVPFAELADIESFIKLEGGF